MSLPILKGFDERELPSGFGYKVLLYEAGDRLLDLLEYKMNYNKVRIIFASQKIRPELRGQAYDLPEKDIDMAMGANLF